MLRQIRLSGGERRKALTRREFSCAICGILLVLALPMLLCAADAALTFSLDSDGQESISVLPEGIEVWPTIFDPDHNVDCDIRDLLCPNLLLFDPKTGAYTEWTTDELGCFEETGANTGFFVANRSIQIGSRQSFMRPQEGTHVLGERWIATSGRWSYADGIRQELATAAGRLENLDTLVALYQDPKDATDIAVCLSKITDTEASMAWDRQIYPDGNEAATITVIDPDENLNCSQVESVPVFILVNPGPWGETLVVTDPPASQPIDLVWLVDESGSMQVGADDHTNRHKMVDGLRSAIDDVLLPYVHAGGTLRLAIISFDDEIKARLPILTDLSSPIGVAAVRTALDDIYDSNDAGETNMAGAIERAREILDTQGNGRGVVNLITDGKPEGYYPGTVIPFTEDEARTAADNLKSGGYELWTLGIKTADLTAEAENFLEEIAGPKPPAGYFLADTFDDFEAIEETKLEEITAGEEHTVETQLTFCQLKRSGGIDPSTRLLLDEPLRWSTLYDSGLPAFSIPGQPTEAGSYYALYPTDLGIWDTASADGVVRVMFYATETGPNTGIFELRLNSLQSDLGFRSLQPRDVLAAYYIDPNDEDDFKLATAFVEVQQHSITSFTDAAGATQEIYWIGRDPIHVQVIDANANVDPCCPEQVVVHLCDVHEDDDVEWILLDETSSNAGIFFSHAGLALLPVWEAMGLGENPAMTGGFQLRLDNWKLEAYNEDDIYVRYNDVYYFRDESAAGREDGIGFVGDQNTGTAFPPTIERIRVANDISFDLMSIADTQVFNGSESAMYFLDSQGNRVSGYTNQDCVFVEVIDLDQNEDPSRRERIASFWDGHQNVPLGPIASVFFNCSGNSPIDHPVNPMLGNLNIFNDGEQAKLYVLNPRNGRWASVDLLETALSSGDFVSTVCIDLAGTDSCLPTLGAIPGDTILAAYQDPSNHSDSAWISIQVEQAVGPPSQPEGSSIAFVDAQGKPVSSYAENAAIYVQVIDPSQAGAESLIGAISIAGGSFDLLPVPDAPAGTFVTDAIVLPVPDPQITAVYSDPDDPEDVSSASIGIGRLSLQVDATYAMPNPFTTEIVLGFAGEGNPEYLIAEVYDLAGSLVWSTQVSNVWEAVWDGANSSGRQVANGTYIYVLKIADGDTAFVAKGVFFRH